MATYWRGGGLKVPWPFRDSGAGLEIQSFPAVLFLAGDYEDLLARARFTKLGSIEVDDLAQAGPWTRKYYAILK